jgi:pimeloyl-ACP methyl ester carboxylesterase
LLVNAGIKPPYVLVGHSFGGLVTRIYADQYLDEVAGMVILDGGQPDIRTERFTVEGREEQAAENRLMTVAPFMARLGFFRLIGTPLPELPPHQRADFGVSYASTGLWDSLYAEAMAISTTDEQVRNTGTLGDRPLMIVNGNMAWLTHGVPMDDTRRVYNELQAELLALSSNSVQHIVDGASHGSLVFNQQNAQETSRAILQVVEAARIGQPLASQ